MNRRILKVAASQVVPRVPELPAEFTLISRFLSIYRPHRQALLECQAYDWAELKRRHLAERVANEARFEREQTRCFSRWQQAGRQRLANTNNNQIPVRLGENRLVEPPPTTTTSTG